MNDETTIHVYQDKPTYLPGIRGKTSFKKAPGSDAVEIVRTEADGKTIRISIEFWQIAEFIGHFVREARVRDLNCTSAQELLGL